MLKSDKSLSGRKRRAEKTFADNKKYKIRVV